MSDGGKWKVVAILWMFQKEICSARVTRISRGRVVTCGFEKRGAIPNAATGRKPVRSSTGWQITQAGTCVRESAVRIVIISLSKYHS